MIKTNALRLLDKQKIKYNTYEYDVSGGFIDGVSVAHSINQDVSRVYKTLVTQGHSREYFVFVIPVVYELDLKKAAALAEDKSVEMIPSKDITKVTGYIKGGCSPIGMKKPYKIFIDESIELIEQIICSAGKPGVQMELDINDIITVTNAKIGDLCKN